MIYQDELDNLNEILTPLICEQNQSIHQALINNKNMGVGSEEPTPIYLCDSIYQLSVDDSDEAAEELSVADVSVSVAGAPVPAIELS